MTDDIHPSKKDALAQALALIPPWSPSTALELPADLDVAALLDTEFGRGRLMEVFLTEIRRHLVDAPAAFSPREVLRTRTLVPGELNRVAKDTNATSFVATADDVEARIYGRYIIPPDIVFKTKVFLPWKADTKMLERGVAVAVHELATAEDAALVRLLAVAAAAHGNLLYTWAGHAAFHDVRYLVDRHRLMTGAYVFQRDVLADMVTHLSTVIEPETQRERLLAGRIGTLEGTPLITSAAGRTTALATGDLYALAGRDYLGEFTTRVPFQGSCELVETADLKGVLFTFAEVVSLCVTNVKAVARAMRG